MDVSPCQGRLGQHPAGSAVPLAEGITLLCHVHSHISLMFSSPFVAQQAHKLSFGAKCRGCAAQDRISGRLGSAGLVAGLWDFGGLFQAK